ncbi:MAG: hypothetical protein WC785_04845 [Tatlockia sp.]|jgi:uridine kinase
MSRIIIAITGSSGSGKTTLSHALAKSFGDNAVCLSTDFYYKGRSPEEPIADYLKKNFDHPDELLLDKFAEDAKNLFEGRSIKRPEIDFKGGTFIRTDNAVELDTRPVIILEGIFCLLHVKVRELVANYGYSIMTHAPSAIVLKRVLERDAIARHKPMELTLSVYTKNVLHGYFDFIKPLKTQCDLRLLTWTREEGDVSVDKLTQTSLTVLLPKLSPNLIETFVTSDSTHEILKDHIAQTREFLLSK